MPKPDADGRHDFDFLFGSWRVHNRRLLQRLAGSTEWEEFETALRTRPVLGGLGNVDTFSAPPWEGFTLRLFDPEAEIWRIWWAATSRPGHLDPPLAGRFSDGHGTFFGDDVHDDRPVRVRFDWTDITPTSARWEQAFSPDAGVTWETNWVMTLSRLDDE
jgi:hypothetical protein